jgi:hypothetical protein
MVCNDISLSVRLLLLCAVTALTSCAGTTARPVSLSGTYVGNAAQSVMLPGERAPRDLLFVVEDNGAQLKTVQSFTAPSGGTVRLIWDGECDGKARPVQGAAPPGIQLSCQRSADGALINTVSGEDWSYVETCMLESKTRLTCKGSMPDDKGVAQPFSYAFDRK